MICLLIMVLIGWILVTVFAALKETDTSIYWVLLPLGTFILCCVLAGVAFYLAFSVKSVQVNRRQANFIDAVTHELKSPIASIKLGLETMARRQLSEKDMGMFTSAMKKDVRRLDRLISHLLQAASLNVENDEIVAEEFEFSKVLDECITDVCTYHAFDKTNIEVRTGPTRYFAAVMDFEIIFRNLLDNAIKYSGTPPKISVNLDEANDGSITVAIENNGTSVPEAERDRVFNRFERTGIELERTKPGVGLGLFIVRFLLKRNRGSVRLETPEHGGGTRVIVELPGMKKSVKQKQRKVKVVAKELNNGQLVG
jgi:signal transduction histidine kinase